MQHCTIHFTPPLTTSPTTKTTTNTTNTTATAIKTITMGNICSRSANKPDDPFSRPGRSLASSAPSEHHRHNKAPAARAPLPANYRQGSGTAGRTVGGGGEEPGTGTDARTRAALAAQKRADAAQTSNKPQGKLGKQLAAQKAQTHSQTLNDVSRSERAARDADTTAEARRWN